MAKTFGIAGESARDQAKHRRRRQQELQRLEQAERNWDAGAHGEESTAEVIAERCPKAVALHDRRMPSSRANIDHIILVPSGVWVVDSKRIKGRIAVEDAPSGTQKLLINDGNQTSLVHKLTGQVNAVKTVMAELDPLAPVHGAFCFWLPIDRKRDLLNPFIEDDGLPLLHTWTINGYPLFYWRLMVRRLNSPGTLSAAHALELAEALTGAFPAAAGEPPAANSTLATSPRPASAASGVPERAPAAERLSKEGFKAMKEEERRRAWESQRDSVEAPLGGPVPPLLSEQLSTDRAVWCHPALWHSRVYLECIHGKVGMTFPYTAAASIVATHHQARPSTPQWRALTAFLEHLRAHGYVEFSSIDGRIGDGSVTADLGQASP